MRSNIFSSNVIKLKSKTVGLRLNFICKKANKPKQLILNCITGNNIHRIALITSKLNH